MPGPFDIRVGDLDDPRIIALLETHLEGARANSPPGSVHALDLNGLRGPALTFWAMWDGAEVVGMGALKALDPEHGEIKSMHTLKALRGRGAATQMLGHILAEARMRGYRRLNLETGSTDYFHPAHALYRRHGFIDCPPFADYVADSFSLCMTRELTA
jgi:putative acetyltransferase